MHSCPFSSQRCHDKDCTLFFLLVKYLAFGHWIISTSKTFDLQIICVDSKHSRTQTITTGLNSLQLENGCAAKSIFFIIPTFECGNTNVALKYQLLNEIKINQLSNNLWEGEYGIMKSLRPFKEQINRQQTSVDKISDFDFQKLNFYLENIDNVPTPPSFVHIHVPWIVTFLFLLPSPSLSVSLYVNISHCHAYRSKYHLKLLNSNLFKSLLKSQLDCLHNVNEQLPET